MNRTANLSVQVFERLLEATGMRLLSLGQGFKPVRDFIETFVAGCFRHTRIHVCVFVGFPFDCSFQVVSRIADREPGCRIATIFQILQMPVGMARFTFGGGTENSGYVVVALNVSFLREVEVTAVCLRLARERVFEVLLGLGSFEFCRVIFLPKD